MHSSVHWSDLRRRHWYGLSGNSRQGCKSRECRSRDRSSRRDEEGHCASACLTLRWSNFTLQSHHRHACTGVDGCLDELLDDAIVRHAVRRQCTGQWGRVRSWLCMCGLRRVKIIRQRVRNCIEESCHGIGMHGRRHARTSSCNSGMQRFHCSSSGVGIGRVGQITNDARGRSR